MNLSDQLRRLLRQCLADLGYPEVPVILEVPPDMETLGDRSTTVALSLARELRLAPRGIADTIAQAILAREKHLLAWVKTVNPGYLNFKWSDEALRGLLQGILDVGADYGSSSLGAGERRLFEFVSANPTGPMNIVSARAAALGNSLVRLQKKIGFDVASEFYVNDSGRQIRLLGESVQSRAAELAGQSAVIPEDGYHGGYVRDLAQVALERFPGDVFSASGDDVGRWAASHIVEDQRRTLKNYGVEFDGWFHESDLYKDGRHFQALGRLTDSGYVYEKDGAKYFRSTAFGDDEDRVVITSDGRPTYFLPDIAYHLHKAERGYAAAIDLLGPDHHGHAQRMQAAMRALGLPDGFLEIIIVQQVNLLRAGQPVKMSKRTGEMITMDELLDEVGVDAAKQIFLSRRWSSHLDFDIEVAKDRSEKSPVFYVQYAHARICSIFKKAEWIDEPSLDDLLGLQAPQERHLLHQLSLFPDVIEGSALQYAPHRLNAYLGDLATVFHAFYHECRVLSDDASLTRARLALCRAVQIVLKEGLRLLGMSAPESM